MFPANIISDLNNISTFTLQHNNDDDSNNHKKIWVRKKMKKRLIESNMLYNDIYIISSYNTNYTLSAYILHKAKIHYYFLVLIIMRK